jgi:hypothetical protein
MIERRNLVFGVIFLTIFNFKAYKIWVVEVAERAKMERQVVVRAMEIVQVVVAIE